MTLKYAKEVLEEDHYGLEQVKERVLEFLAVRSLTKKGRSSDPLSGGTAGNRKDIHCEISGKSIERSLMFGFLWEECGMKRRSGDTGRPMWELCRDGLPTESVQQG